MDVEREVVVVGGGATGASVARDLALRGVDVTLVERGPLTAGTTGRSHGVLHSGARYAESDPAGAAECIRENRILREIGGACVAETDGLFVSLPADPEEFVEEKLAGCRECDIPTEVVSGAAARELEPKLSPDVERAIRVPDGVVSPSRLVAATAADARDHGAAIETHAEVRDVLVEDDRVVSVEVERDGERTTIGAAHVVNATGPWAGSVAALAGVEVEMKPTRGVMCVFDVSGVTHVLNRCRPPADGDIAVPHAERVVVGTTSVPVDDPSSFPRDRGAVERMRIEGQKLIPEVATADCRRWYWGVRPLYAPDESDGGRGISRDFTVLDHRDDGVAGFTSVVGGKLTTARLMAEAVADHVCSDLGVSARCETADAPLPAEDPTHVDALVREFGPPQPADEDVIGSS